MNTKERYNRIIDRTDSLIFSYDKNENYYSESKIAKIVTEEEGIGARELNSIFSFLLGETFHQYVRERRLTIAYNRLIEDSDCQMEELVEFTRYDNQSSFIKGFKAKFGCSPGKVKENRNEYYTIGKKTWESLSEFSCREYESRHKLGGETKFGVPTELIERYEYALDLQELYEMDDVESEIAFRLASFFDVDLMKAFEFISQWTINDYFCGEDDSIDGLVKCICDEYREVMTLFFICPEDEITVSEAKEYVRMLKGEGVPIKDVEYEIFRIYQESNSASFSYFELKEMYEEYQELYPNETSDFVEHLPALEMGTPVECLFDI